MPIREETTDPSGCFIIHATVAPGHEKYLVVVHRQGYKPVSATVFSGREVNEVELHMVPVESREAGSARSWERPLTEPTYYQVRCSEDPHSAPSNR